MHWFVSNMEGVSSMNEAVRIGQRLIELGMILEVQGHTIALTITIYNIHT